jgi:thioredoxin-like negative regulator of GroEL
MVNLYVPTPHTDEEIRAALQTTGRTILFLNADWCGDCTAIKPFVGAIRERAEQQAHWIDADRDANLAVALDYHLRGIPAFALFENGQRVSHIGNGQRLAAQEVLDWLESVV